MTNSSRSWLFFGVAASLVTGSAVLVGMTNHPSVPPENEGSNSHGFSSSTLQARDLLKTELVRRFNDLSVPEFGASRMIGRLSDKRHAAVMDRAADAGSGRWHEVGDGSRQRQVYADGKWISANAFKPALKAENVQEEKAIQLFKDGQVDVAMYTLGSFELDKGEKADLSHEGFSYDGGDTIRVKGPIYLGQDSAPAPRASALIDVGRLAWASRQTDYSTKGKDGWVYFVHRVDASKSECISCHGDRPVVIQRKVVKVKGIAQREGDPVGLFVIALRKADSK